MPIKPSEAYIAKNAYRYPSITKSSATATPANDKTKIRSTRELTDYLRQNYTTVQAGKANISAKYLQKCVDDDKERQRLFDCLAVADETMQAAKNNGLGIQHMEIKIDDDGNAVMISSKSTVSVNEDKRRRQIAAAATKDNIEEVLRLLQIDLEQVEDGLQKNMCDEAEVKKVKKLIEEAKQRQQTLSDRAATPCEQATVAVNMLI